LIIESLKEVCHPFGIYERSDASVREKEGLEEKTGWIGAEHNPVITIKENGVLLTVDLEKGQKTGYFLDQKFNRKIVSAFANGKTVLDTFTHTGAFALNCALAGAKEVTAVDISPEAVETVNNNIKINNQQKTVTAVCADVFDLLREYEQTGKTFDMIILNPPAFTKSAKMVQKAYGGYKEINLRALKILKPGGILVTCSCSHFFDTNTFYSMIQNAAEDARKTIQILEKRGAGPDHPVLVGYPKSEYLKCAILRVM
jgi:23S rRNA (cytosine1962-C5)-methyltransferase